MVSIAENITKPAKYCMIYPTLNIVVAAYKYLGGE